MRGCPSRRAAVGTPPRRRMVRPRRVARALTCLLALSLAGACTKTTTPPPEPPPSGEPAPLGDTSAAYAGHPSAAAGPTRRERPPARPVGDRDAALDAVIHGNPEGAIDFLRGHVQQDPGDLPARLALARAQLMVGQLQAAADTLADPAGAPGDPEVLLRRARL